MQSKQSKVTTFARCRILTSLILAFLVPVLVIGPTVPAEGQPPSLGVERVALFKNGLGLFASRGTLPARVTTVDLGDLPVPVHGTFWVDLEKNTKLRGVFARLQQLTEEKPVSSIPDLLASNVGREVHLEPGPVVGELVSATPELALVQTDQGIVAIDPAMLDRALIAGNEIRRTREVETEKSVLRLELAEPAGGAEVFVSYLAKGISWAPSYRIDLSHPETAAFSSEAVILNEALDLLDVDIDLVTGFPNLRFSDVPSPLDSGQTLEAFFSALQSLREGSSPSYGSASMQQVMANVFISGTSADLSYSTMPDEGQVAEDLFYFPAGKMTLRRGEKAWVPLTKAEMPYAHVYSWEIPDFFDRRENRYGRRDEAPKEELVWHTCRLTNSTSMPLTTAPVQFFQDGRIVGQDLMTYTPAGATIDIRVNRALGLAVDPSEVELRRELQAVTLHRYTYDRVWIRGELEIRNLLGKPARVEVTKSLSGEVKETTDDPEVTHTTDGLLRPVNPSHRLQWTLDLETGEERTIRYEHTVLVRSG